MANVGQLTEYSYTGQLQRSVDLNEANQIWQHVSIECQRKNGAHAGRTGDWRTEYSSMRD